MFSTSVTLFALSLPASATDPECVGPNGYTPPTYSATELVGFLSTVPTVAEQAQTALLLGQPQTSPLFTPPWTNWYDEPLEQALVKLSVQRGILDAANLQSAYLPGALTDNLSPGAVVCGPETLDARTADGTCNDLNDPAAGAVDTRFGRNVPLALAYPDPSTLLSPSPREVSLRLLRRRGAMEEIPFLNLWAAAWTQFQIHDWFDHGDPDTSNPLAIPLGPLDPMRRRTGQTSIVVGSTPADTTRLPSESSLPPTYQNVVTHWWDGSQIYGSDQATADRLRSFQGGHLQISGDALPLNAEGFGDSGFTSNWWVGLELLHSLFVQEHNAIADHLASVYPSMTDQELYEKARLVNAALMAKIHTLEWTPAILPNRTLDIAMNANWYGLEQYVTPAEQPRLTMFVEPPDAAVYGIVGGDQDNKGVAYSITEDFAAIYRMHQMLPDVLRLRTVNGTFAGLLATEDATNAGGRDLFDQRGFLDLAVSFGLSNPGALTLRNYPRFMTSLPAGPFEIDLAAIDILRDRERGLPRYNNYRRGLNLLPLASIDELTDDPVLRATLKQVYNNDIEQVDLFVGTLAEAQRPDCYGFGETLFQTFILMASRRLQADRFYTNDYRPGVYTQEGLDWVENNTFKSVLLRHYPQLANTGLATVDNAFTPWTTNWSVP